LQAANKTKNTKEEVDKIEIEANCSENVLVGGKATVDKVRVIDDISTEQQSASNGVNEVEGGAEREDGADETCHNCHTMR
jgi:hypothetical protein